MPSASKATTGTAKGTKRTVKASGTKSTPAAKTKRTTKTASAASKPKAKATKTTKTASKTTKRTRSKSAAKDVKPVITSEERHRMISEAAYYLAEKRGFVPGHEESDWLQASKEVDSMIINS